MDGAKVRGGLYQSGPLNGESRVGGRRRRIEGGLAQPLEPRSLQILV